MIFDSIKQDMIKEGFLTLSQYNSGVKSLIDYYSKDVFCVRNRFIAISKK
jgi:hypothetical protein